MKQILVSKSGVGIIKRLIEKKDGSITLEAAMILPIFMIFIMFLATFIRLAVADMALYESASGTSEVVVSYAYPADIATSSAGQIIDDKLKSIDIVQRGNQSIDLSQVVDWTDDALEFFGIDVAGAAEDFFNSVIQEDVLEPLVQDNFRKATGNWDYFDPGNLTLTNVKKVGSYLQMDVEYNMDITFPFFEKTVTLKKTSYERMWTGK